MTILIIILFLTDIGAFVIRAWANAVKANWLVARDRWGLLTGFVAAMTAFAIVSLPLEEVIVPSAIWLVGVGLLAGGVAGAALRWPDLPWYAGAKPRWRAVGAIATFCVCGLLIGLAVVTSTI